MWSPRFARPASERARRRLAWLAPVVVAGAVTAGVMLSSASGSAASPTLPSRTAAQLLADVQRSATTAFSGDVQEVANLGLPSLPGSRSSASLSWQTFVTGTHSARVWSDGPDKQRVALLGELSEADVVHNGQDVWTYTSAANTVTHSVLRHGAQAPAVPTPSDASPAAAAARLLAAIGPSTSVTVDTSRMVAGRPAYTLVLRPRDARSTVHKVAIAIDAKKYLPLQVQVFGAGSSPALQIGFTRITFATPPASTFTFRAPAGATTSNNPIGMTNRHADRHRREHSGPIGTPERPASAEHSPKTIGTGWTSVIELPSGSAGALGDGTLRDLTSAVGNSGERLLHTALVNAVLLPDGRTFVGAVSPALLEHIAATTPN